jgi:hypothetical protein
MSIAWRDDADVGDVLGDEDVDVDLELYGYA